MWVTTNFFKIRYKSEDLVAHAYACLCFQTGFELGIGNFKGSKANKQSFARIKNALKFGKSCRASRPISNEHHTNGLSGLGMIQGCMQGSAVTTPPPHPTPQKSKSDKKLRRKKEGKQ